MTMEKKRAGRTAEIFVTLVISTVIGLVLAEIIVRSLVPQHLWRFTDATADWELDARLGWVQRGDMHDKALSDFGWVLDFKTNEDGLLPQPAKRETDASLLRVMLFGDSTVVGRAVPENDRVHVQLQTALERKGVKAQVFNAGVQGYSTDQALLRIKELLPLYKPDTIIYGLCDNDFGGIVQSQAYGMQKPRFRLASDGALIEIPPNEQSTINAFGGGWRSWLQHAALYRLVQPYVLVFRARFGNWEQRNLLGLAPDLYYDRKAINRVNWELLSAIFREMAKTADAHGARFLFYSHPALGEVWEPFVADTKARLGAKAGHYDRYAIEKRLQGIAAKNGLIFIPLIDYFLARQNEGPFHLLPRDPHSNPTGYHLIAEAISARITPVSP